MTFKDIPKFCISLERSSDRRAMVSKELRDAQIMPFSFFPATDRKALVLPELSKKKENEYNAVGALACMTSHVELMKYALRMRHEEICVFEDDIILCPDFHERIKYIEDLKIPYDMFLLGGHFNSTKPGTLVGAAEGTEESHIFKVLNMAGTYGYIIKKPVMEFVIRNIHYNWGIDQFFSDIVYRHFNCFAFVPFLVGCRPGKSEITGAFGDYPSIKYYYQDGPVDLSKQYENPTETEEKKNQNKIDKQRQEWLASNP